MILVTGLPRAGSMSVAKALEILGYNTLFYCPLTDQGDDWTSRSRDYVMDYDVVVDWSIAGNMDLWIRAFDVSKIIFLNRIAGWKDSIEQFNSGNCCDEYLKDLLHGTRTAIKTDIPYIVLDIVKNPRWKELCVFLDKPIPEIKFPHLNQAPINYTI